jgi:hypothetical protein
MRIRHQRENQTHSETAMGDRKSNGVHLGLEAGKTAAVLSGRGGSGRALRVYGWNGRARAPEFYALNDFNTMIQICMAPQKWTSSNSCLS